MGDFNAYRCEDENVGGAPKVMSTDEFNRCLYPNDLMDMTFTGPLITWSNRRDEGTVSRKLDRV